MWLAQKAATLLSERMKATTLPGVILEALLIEAIETIEAITLFIEATEAPTYLEWL